MLRPLVRLLMTMDTDFPDLYVRDMARVLLRVVTRVSSAHLRGICSAPSATAIATVDAGAPLNDHHRGHEAQSQSSLHMFVPPGGGGGGRGSGQLVLGAAAHTIRVYNCRAFRERGTLPTGGGAVVDGGSAIIGYAYGAATNEHGGGSNRGEGGGSGLPDHDDDDGDDSGVQDDGSTRTPSAPAPAKEVTFDSETVARQYDEYVKRLFEELQQQVESAASNSRGGDGGGAAAAAVHPTSTPVSPPSPQLGLPCTIEVPFHLVAVQTLAAVSYTHLTLPTIYSV